MRALPYPTTRGETLRPVSMCCTLHTTNTMYRRPDSETSVEHELHPSCPAFRDRRLDSVRRDASSPDRRCIGDTRDLPPVRAGAVA